MSDKNLFEMFDLNKNDILPQPSQGLMFLFNFKDAKSVEFRSNLILLTSTCLVKTVLRIIKCRRRGGGWG